VVFVDSVDGNRWHSVAVVYAHNTVCRELKKAIVGADPYFSISVLVNRSHKVIEQALLSREGSKRTVLIADQSTAFGRNPQNVITCDRQAKDVVIGKSSSVLTIK
jgi:hypothetical protein